MSEDIGEIADMFLDIGLNEYQAKALSYLMLLGEAKATTLSKVSGIPSAKIYEIAEDLARIGLIVIKPGRPSVYVPREPDKIVDLLVRWQRVVNRDKIESLKRRKKRFVEIITPIYTKGLVSKRHSPLLRIVGTGALSLEETRSLYRLAEKEISIFSRAMEYLPNVNEELKGAIKRNVKVQIILMDPKKLSDHDRKIQEKNVSNLNELGMNVEIRYCSEVPIRGCVIDDKAAIFLTEELAVPIFLRETAITTNPGLVKGLQMLFDLAWQYRCKPLDLKYDET